MASVTPDLVKLYADSDALGLADLVRRGEGQRPGELVETAIAIVEDLEPRLNAVVIRTFDKARAEAARWRRRAPSPAFHILLKNIGSMWKGTRLTAGLRYLENFVCDIDLEMVARIKQAGFVLLGRTNTPEARPVHRHGAPALWSHDEPLEPGRHAGRFERRVRGRRRRAHGAAGRGVRRRRIHPRARRVLRTSRPKAIAGTDTYGPRDVISGWGRSTRSA